MPTPDDLMGYGMPNFLAGELGNRTQSVTGTGTAQTGGAAILSEGHIALVTAASSQTAVVLPSGAKIGTPYFIVGVGSAAPIVYPPSGGTINAGSANAGLTLSAATATAILVRASTTAWYSFPLAP